MTARKRVAVIACLVVLPAFVPAASAAARRDGDPAQVAAVAQSAPRTQPADPAERPWLGVTLGPVSEEARAERQIPAGIGVRIESVVEGSAAARASLRAGDIVVQVDGEEVKGIAGFISLIQARRRGDSVKLWYFRDGKKRTATVALGGVGERERRAEREAPASESAKEAPEKPAEPEIARRPRRTGRAAGRREGAPAPEAARDARPGFLGVLVQGVSDETRERLGLGEGEGVEVQSTIEGSAAERAGLRAGDVLLEIGGSKVGDPATLVDLLRSRSAGDEVSVVFLRDGKRETLDVELGARSDSTAEAPSPARPPRAAESPARRREAPPAPEPPPAGETRGERSWLGVEPADVEISAELREVLGIEEGEGVRIERVVDESPAAKAGLERNDLILRIDGRKIASSTALGDSIARSAAGQTISIALVRKGKRESVNVTLASRPR